ncbi:hypothetical protein, unlikely [Trypanosoma congolense IL3000]|uniref:Uncharacterized protein n=1 Tax=Trypanosoma congolense (strain IL3000) TaxID=1068625 RepID=F9W6P3_TRYCI|nr:hypothetical protein, unlikely [Trypanosoma congolense IL3000]
MIWTTCPWKPSTRRSGVGVGARHHPHTNPARESFWWKQRRLSYKCRTPPSGTSFLYHFPPDHGLGYRTYQFYFNYPVVFEKTYIARNAFLIVDFFWEGLGEKRNDRKRRVMRGTCMSIVVHLWRGRVGGGRVRVASLGRGGG